MGATITSNIIIIILTTTIVITNYDYSRLMSLALMRGEKLMGFALEEQKKKVIPSIGPWKKRKLRRRSCIVLWSRSRICIVEELMGFALEAPKKAHAKPLGGGWRKRSH